MKKLIYSLGFVMVLIATSAYAHCGKCGVDAKQGKHGDKAAHSSEKKIGMLKSELGLSDEQAQKIKPLIDEKMAKKDALKEEYYQKKQEVKDEYSAKIKAILNDEQAEKFEQWKAPKVCPMGCTCPKCQAKKGMSGEHHGKHDYK